MATARLALSMYSRSAVVYQAASAACVAGVWFGFNAVIGCQRQVEPDANEADERPEAPGRRIPKKCLRLGFLHYFGFAYGEGSPVKQTTTGA
jgi:hypothetical protein